MADFSSGFSATMASVVSSMPATEAAFCKAVRTTLAGSIIPALNRSSYSSDAALKPKAPLPSLTFCSAIDPSTPALIAIRRKRFFYCAFNDADSRLLLLGDSELF